MWHSFNAVLCVCVLVYTSTFACKTSFTEGVRSRIDFTNKARVIPVLDAPVQLFWSCRLDCIINVVLIPPPLDQSLIASVPLVPASVFVALVLARLFKERNCFSFVWFRVLPALQSVECCSSSCQVEEKWFGLSPVTTGLFCNGPLGSSGGPLYQPPGVGNGKSCSLPVKEHLLDANLWSCNLLWQLLDKEPLDVRQAYLTYILFTVL